MIFAANMACSSAFYRFFNAEISVVTFLHKTFFSGLKICSNISTCRYSHHMTPNMSYKLFKTHLLVKSKLPAVSLTTSYRHQQTIFTVAVKNSAFPYYPKSGLFLRNKNKLLFISKHGNASFQNIDNDLLMKYLDSLNEEYNQIFDTYSKGNDRTKDMNSRRLFLTPIVKLYAQLKEKYKELDELKQLSKEDDQMKSMVEAEVPEIEEQINHIRQQILENVVPDIKYDKNDAILELNPGVGGEEAKLFNLDIYNMYAGYAAFKGWTFLPETVQLSDNDGLIKARILISGYGVFKWLKFEAGTHRVQRVPKTEKAGRIHTSTSSVAVLPKPDEIDITVDQKDLQIDTFRASGAGGQHVNTTDSAVRVTHLPTGLVTTCQEDRSQISNRKTALNKLRTMLYEKEFNAQMSEIRSQRKLQVGTAGRSEKIRTYNFAQNRVTDHRIHHTAHDLAGFLSGGQVLDNFIQKLLQESREETLVEILDEFKAKLS